MPRTRWQPPDLDEVRELASRGLTHAQIARYYGIHPDTITNHKKYSPEFSDAIERGKVQGIKKVVSCLMKAIEDGDVAAMKFYLVNQANWRHRPKEEDMQDIGRLAASMKAALNSAEKRKRR